MSRGASTTGPDEADSGSSTTGCAGRRPTRPHSSELVRSSSPRALGSQCPLLHCFQNITCIRLCGWRLSPAVATSMFAKLPSECLCFLFRRNRRLWVYASGSRSLYFIVRDRADRLPGKRDPDPKTALAQGLPSAYCSAWRGGTVDSSVDARRAAARAAAAPAAERRPRRTTGELPVGGGH